VPSPCLLPGPTARLDLPASKVLHGHHGGGKVYGYHLVPQWPDGLAEGKRGAKTASEPASKQRGRGRDRSPDLSGLPTWGRIPADRPTAERTRHPLVAREAVVRPQRRPDDSAESEVRRRLNVGEVTVAEGPERPDDGWRARPRAGEGTPSPHAHHGPTKSEWFLSSSPELRIVPDELWNAVQARFAGRRG
jgi:hypothetical protein